MKRKSKPCPDAGAYRKIDVYARPVHAIGYVYLHSTDAYPTLRQAIIGAALSLERRSDSSGCRTYVLTVHDAGGYAVVQLDPYSIKAKYAVR